MKIGGFQPCSLCDYPGKISAVVFTQGCNFRCPFCHNGSLIPSSVAESRLIPAENVLAKLKIRVGQIDGVVISGGEPTLQEDLNEFAHAVIQMGFAIKLDTNGSRPLVLSRLLEDGLLNYVAMDIKAPWPKYAALIGASRAPLDEIAESMRILSKSGVSHEFRTTFVQPLLEEDDLGDIRASLPVGSTWKSQGFRAGRVREHAVFSATRF